MLVLVLCNYDFLKCSKNDVPIYASVTHYYTTSASIPTDYPVFDSNLVSINKGGRQKWMTNENIRLTEIIIANANIETTDIVYKKKIELDGKNPPVGFLQNNIDEVVKNITCQKITR